MLKFEAIEVGPRSGVEVDVEGRWLVRWGVPITIRGFKFFFVPTSNSKNVKIEAYSLDSLKLFDDFSVSKKAALEQCATEEGFIFTVMPLIAQIDINLRKLSDDKWRSILKSERVTAIAECGARSEKERWLLKEFDSKGVSK